MKLFRIEINITGPIGTVMKGDTLFGQFVWQLARDESLAGPIQSLLANYSSEPFAIFSSAFVSNKNEIALPIPALPSFLLFETKDANQRKQTKKKHWLVYNFANTLQVNQKQCFTDKELIEKWLGKDSKYNSLFTEVERVHNTINRLSGTTGEGRFAPFRRSSHWLVPNLSMTIIAGIQESKLSEQALVTALERIGQFGFGRNASVGMGQFSIEKCEPLEIVQPSKVNAGYALSPFMPVDETPTYSKPFTRFGRHGDELATSAAPFKEPVLLMDEGAVVSYQENVPQFIGRGMNELSHYKETVMQGYSLLLPFFLER